MKPKSISISLFLAVTITVGCLGMLLYSGSFTRFSDSSDTIMAQTLDGPRFRYLGGSFAGDHATYTFQTPPEEKTFPDDCRSCEVGNAVIFAEFGCSNNSKYLFDSNSERGVFEKTPLLDKDGSVVGEQRLVVFKNKEKITGARMFWIEGKDFWAVQAPTVEATRELSKGDDYKRVRQKVAEEMKSYVPIQNANTIGKNPCDGFNQRRVIH